MTTDEIQDDIVTYAVENYGRGSLLEYPYVATYVAPNRDSVVGDWMWTRIGSITAEFDGSRGCMRFMITSPEGKPCSGGFKNVDGSTFNELARGMLRAAIQEAMGVDPDNPDDADFAPVSNHTR